RWHWSYEEHDRSLPSPTQAARAIAGLQAERRDAAQWWGSRRRFPSVRLASGGHEPNRARGHVATSRILRWTPIARRQKRLACHHSCTCRRGGIPGDRRQDAQGINQGRIDPELRQGTLHLFLAGGTTRPPARGFGI